MGKMLIRCKKLSKPIWANECLYKKDQIIKDDKTCLQCLKKNKISILGKLPQTTVNTPKAFADAYLNGKSIFQENIFDDPIMRKTFPDITLAWEAHILYGKSRPVNRALKELNLSPLVKQEVYTALENFTLGIYAASKGVVRKRVEKTRNAQKITHPLKKILKNPIFPNQTKKIMEEQLRVFQKDGKEEKNYSELEEINPIRTLFQLMIYDDILETISPKAEPGCPAPLPMHEDLKKFMLQERKEAIENEHKYNVKMGNCRPMKLFIKAMLIAIHRLLTERGKIRVERAKKYTAKIVKEYLIKRGFTGFANLTPKGVDNALHR